MRTGDKRATRSDSGARRLVLGQRLLWCSLFPRVALQLAQRVVQVSPYLGLLLLRQAQEDGHGVGNAERAEDGQPKWRSG